MEKVSLVKSSTWVDFVQVNELSKIHITSELFICVTLRKFILLDWTDLVPSYILLFDRQSYLPGATD